MEHRGFFLIADITGYTMYLSESELEHALQTLTDLLELVVDQTRPPLILAQLEGDAVLSYAFTDGFVSAQTFLERIEETYVEFRRAIDLKVLNNTCRCNACANVSELDLKFFVHHGSFAMQPVGDITQLVGTDVNLVHRLLKNAVTANTGIRAYLLLTEDAVQALEIDPVSEGMIAHTEAVPDFGDVRVRIEDMQPLYETAQQGERTFYGPEDVLMTVTVDIPMPVEHVWNYANQSQFRNILTGSTSYEVMDRVSGRVGTGSTYQCYHGKMIVTQLVMEWLPFDRVVIEQLAPIPGREPTTAILDLRFTPIDDGTRLSLTATKATGPLLQRSFARLMMAARRRRAKADLREFREEIVADHTALHRPGASVATLDPSRIETSAAASLEAGQAALED